MASNKNIPHVWVIEDDPHEVHKLNIMFDLLVTTPHVRTHSPSVEQTLALIAGVEKQIIPEPDVIVMDGNLTAKGGLNGKDARQIVAELNRKKIVAKIVGNSSFPMSKILGETFDSDLDANKSPDRAAKIVDMLLKAA